MYKVFFNDRTLFLTGKLDQDLPLDFNAIHKYTSHHELLQFIRKFEENNNLTTGFVYGRNESFLLSVVKKCYRQIKDAGVLIINSQDEVLMVKAHGILDLPRGKVRKGEKTEETVRRVVEKKCNIRNAKIRHKLLSTFYIYKAKDVFWFKETVWYLLDYSEISGLSSQSKTNITLVQWVGADKLPHVNHDTCPSLSEVFKTAGLYL